MYAAEDLHLVGQESASVQFAGGDRSFHRIRYDPHYVEHLDHLVAHECGHILRWSTAPATERVLPVMTQKNRRKARAALAGHVPRLQRVRIPKEAAHGLVDFWVRGMVSQVTNIPIDIRIERWLHDAYPGLRAAQRRRLQVQLAEYRLALAPQIKALSPWKVFRTANAINYAYAVEVGALIGQPEAAEAYTDQGIRGLGERLRNELGKGYVGDHRGDRAVADRWAQIMRVRDWYQWMDPFET